MDIGFQNVSWKDLPQLLECMRENYTADRLGFDPDAARSAWLEVLNHEELRAGLEPSECSGSKPLPESRVSGS